MMSFDALRTRWSARLWVGVIASLTGLLGPGCVRAKREPTVQVQCLGAAARTTSVALPDSHWLQIDASTIEKISPLGELSWSTKLPASDSLLPELSVAANNTVYLRDKERVLALGSQGNWLWERPEPIQGASDATYSPVAMSDSGVVVRSGPQVYHAYSHTGALRWSVEVPLKEGPQEKPIVLPNGLIIVRGGSDVVCLSPNDGKVEWQQSRG